MKRFISDLPVSKLFLILITSSVGFLFFIGLLIYFMFSTQQELERKYEQVSLLLARR